MAQTRYWNFLADDKTADINRWLTGLVLPGVYFGYDFSPTADLVLNLVHTSSGFSDVDDAGVEKTNQALVVTRQGTVIKEDAAIQLNISAGDVSLDRTDVIILSHVYNPVSGGQQALYSVIEGTPGAGVPVLTDPLSQIKIGELFVPSGTTQLDDVGVVWTIAPRPSFAGFTYTADRALISDSLGAITTSSITATELSRLSGVTSNIQTQLDGKEPTINLTTNRALVSNGSGKVAVSLVTDVELDRLDGLTVELQTTLDSLQSQITSNDGDIAGKQDTITGGATTITSTNLTTNRALISDGSGKVAVSAVTSTELGYLDTVTSNIQTQLNGKQATITGGATTITTSNLTVSRALISNGSGKVAVSLVTDVELDRLDGLTVELQTTLDSLQSQITSNDGDIAGKLDKSDFDIAGSYNVVRKYVDIGTWDLQNDPDISVTIGTTSEFTAADILSITGIVISDVGTTARTIPYFGSSTGLLLSLAIGNIFTSGSDIICSLYRDSGSNLFNSTDWDGVQNRGYLIIDYKV